jgi:hypothetical protein
LRASVFYSWFFVSPLTRDSNQKSHSISQALSLFPQLSLSSL